MSHNPRPYDGTVKRRRAPFPSQTPGFERVVLSVTEQDVGLPALGEEGVRAVLKDVPFEWGFAWTARVDAEVAHGRLSGEAAHAQLRAVAWAFDRHPKQRELLELTATESRELFNTPYLHALQRLLVLDAAEGDEGSPEAEERMQAASLGIANVVSPDTERPSEWDRDHFVALTIRSGVENSTESVVDAIARAYAIYHELPRRPDASQVPNFLAREQWEPAPTSALTVHERFMVGMAVLGHVGVWGGELAPPGRPTGVPPEYFEALANELQGGDGTPLERAIAGDRAFYRRMFERAGSSQTRPSNSIPFQTRPLLAQRNGGYLLSSTNALASWMTRGVHYACLTPIEGTRNALSFLTYVGRLFETYALELLEDALREQTSVRVIGEQPYDRGSSATSDIAVIDGNDLVLIEVEAHRFTKEALLGSDPGLVLDELDTMIIDKARQLHDCIDALRREQSRATLPGVAMDAIERIWPVVVIEGGITQTALLWDHLNERVAGMLEQAGVQRLSILTMDDLHAAAGFIESGHRLALLLHRWKFGRKKHTDFAYYCSQPQV
jgi:hypothetical protein